MLTRLASYLEGHSSEDKLNLIDNLAENGDVKKLYKSFAQESDPEIKKHIIIALGDLESIPYLFYILNSTTDKNIMKLVADNLPLRYIIKNMDEYEDYLTENALSFLESQA